MNILPVIRTDFIEQPPAELEEEKISEPPEDVNKETGEKDPQFVYEDEPKPKLTQEDIFMNDEPKNKPIKEKKKRKPMTEEQKERLAKGRAKALENRRKKAQEKKDMAELEKKVKNKKKQDMIDFVEEKPKPPTPTPTPQPAPQPQMNIEEITQKAVAKALHQHEEARQKRKVQKHQKAKEDQLKNMVLNAHQQLPQQIKYGDAGFFNKCF